jgi:hypothetical protein
MAAGQAQVQGSTVYSIAFGVLMFCLVLGVLLFTRLIGNDDASGGFEVGRPQPTPCPVGQHAPLCYQFDVTNTGEADVSAQCAILAEDGMTAQFLNGDSEYIGSVVSGQTIRLYAKVDATEGNTVAAPNVRCGAL